MALQPLDEVRRALSNAWDLTRAGFWWRTAEAAADSGDWGTAANRLLHLADPLDAVPTGDRAWQQLTVATLDAALRAGSSDMVTAACAQLLGRAWEPGDDLDALVVVFRTAEAVKAFEAGHTLARILRQRYTNSAWANYATGHFEELAAAGKRGVASGRLVENFERAAELFEARAMTREAHHARLRAAVARMAHGTQHDIGRQALRDVAAGVDEDDRYWLAFGQLHSPFWLDRVRAGDWVGDEMAATHGEGPRADRARKVAALLVRRLPVSIADAEHDRIRAASEAFDDELRWEVEAQLRGREAAAAAASEPLSAISAEFADSLESEALPLDGFVGLVDAWQGRTARQEPRSPVARAVVEVLRADDAALSDATRALAAAVREADDARSLRPVLLVFVRIAAKDGEADLSAALTELALHYAQRAPAPSCGFLAVAKTLFDGGHHRAAAALTRRAMDDGDRADGFALCVSRSIAWAAREGSDREMLAWLEAGERELR